MAKGSNQYKSKPRKRAIFLAFLIVAGSWLYLVTTVVNTVMPISHADAPKANLTHAWVDPTKFIVPSLNPNLTEREQNIQLIKKIWGSDASIGLAIARCESGYRTHAENRNTNGTIDQGVFQINSVHNLPEMENAVANILEGYRLYVEQGTAPWNSSKSCWN